ncbi:MAG: arsenic metallochaperone ArsD family protein [Deltaproteobacteria bacterium]|nr:arsenic metallochaperone ArsD family protein [Deltaproteobacteria bacterium]
MVVYDPAMCCSTGVCGSRHGQGKRAKTL